MVKSFCWALYLEQRLRHEADGDEEGGAFAGEQHVDGVYQHRYEIDERDEASPHDACDGVVMDKQGEDA